MFDFELKFNEILMPSIYVLLILFLIWRANGLGNVLRFLVRYYKVSYSDKKMKELDEVWFNIQLFRFTTGINVPTLEKARKIQEKLNTGEIELSTFKFIGAWGDVTVPISFWKAKLSYLVAVLFISFGTLTWYMQNPIVYDYVHIKYGDLNYYISNDKVIMNPKDIPPDVSEAKTKKDCLDILKSGAIPPGSPYETYCNKLLEDSDLAKNRLNGKIARENSAKRNLTLASYAYWIYGICIAFTLYRFNRANEILRAAIGNTP